MIATRGQATSTDPGRVAWAVERLSPLGWLAIYLVLPVSGWATVMFTSWFDQRRDLEALRSLLDDGRAEAIADSVIGPAYIASAALVHLVSGLSPEDSLVALTRASYALSVAGGMVLVGAVVRRLVQTSPLVSIAAQLAFVALVFSAGTWHWSDVPWSHFYAAFLAVAFYAARFGPARVTPTYAALAGIALALLALTRSFELVAVLLAAGIAFALLRPLGLSPRDPLRIANLAWGAGAFLVTTAAVYAATGKRDAFFLYGNHLGNQSGDLPSSEIAETPTLSPLLVPVKLVQLFVEPCFYALCSLSNYAGSSEALPPSLSDPSGQERLWRLPLAVQLPALVLLPLCLVAVTVLVVWFARHRAAAQGRERTLRLLVELSVAATGLVLGYAASTLTGSPHLRFGFARDFLLAATLTGVLAAGLGVAGLWLLVRRVGPVRLPRGQGSVSPETVLVLGVAVVAVVVVALGSLGRAYGLPRLESRQLGSVGYTADCSGAACRIDLRATTTGGQPISIPRASVLTFGCGSSEARLSVYDRDPADGVRITRPCADPRLVAAWPTVMGLPPDDRHLRAVRVSNTEG